MEVKDSNIYCNIDKYITLNTGEYFIIDNIVISEFHEGAHIDINTSQDFFDFIKTYYNNHPFYFISNRIHQFSVSPLDLANYSTILPNLKSICAVTYANHLDYMNAEIEKRFHNIPYHITDSIEHALLWTKSIISKKSIA